MDPKPHQKVATLKDLRKVRRDLTIHIMRAMEGLGYSDWPGDSFSRMTPILEDGTIDPDVLGLLVFMTAGDLESAQHYVEESMIPCVPATLGGVTGWVVLTFNPNMRHDDDGRGERRTWSTRFCSWVCPDGMQEAPAIHEPYALVWGWDVVELENLH